MATMQRDGAVTLNYNGAAKFATTSGGATVTGTCTATTFSGSGASLTSLNATNLSSGEVDTARLPITYTKADTVTIQATGATHDVRLDAADHIILEAGEEEAGNIYFRGNGGTGSYRFAQSGLTTPEGLLDFESLTGLRTFTFPDTTDTLAVQGDLTDGSVTKVANNFSTTSGQIAGFINDGGGNLGLRFNATAHTSTLIEAGSAWELEFANDSESGDFTISRSTNSGPNSVAGETITWEAQLKNEGSDLSLIHI